MSEGMRGQRRGGRIAMSGAELAEFLGVERTCRVATIGADGAPHLSALWFVWEHESLWLYSLVRSQRWANLARDPRANVLVDAGHSYGELRGVQLSGEAAFVGEAPRTGQPCDELIAVEARYARKYGSADELQHDGRHGWVRLTPSKIVSWDFRKMPRGGA